MFTEEERAKWRERVARWRNGELVYDAGKIVEKSDNTSVQKQEPILPIKRDFVAEATRKHAAEAVGPDTRSLYLREQSQSAKQYANQQYQKAKDDAKRAEGLELMMKTISPSTYVEAATGLDLGTAGRLITDAAAFGFPGAAKSIVRSTMQYGRKFLLPKKAATVTNKNAASMTPEQWTTAQDAAIARGDMAEAQRLRDLHFKVSAPKTEVVDINGNPQLVVHKTPNTFTVFDNNRSIGKLNWFATPNAYGENGVFATGAGKNPRTMKLYVNMRNAHKPTIDEGIEPAYINQGEDGLLGIVDKDMTNYFKSSRDAGEGFMMSGGVDNPNALKSANAITYDNKGIRIPLGERDNFNMSDIRYGIIPLISGSTGYGLYNKYAE